jgi:hypothetical protein
MSGDSRPTLQAELDRLIDQFGEAKVVATLEARTKRLRGRPPADDLLYLFHMARNVGRVWPAGISSAGRGRKKTPLEKNVSRAAKEIAPLIPRYDPKLRKDVQKTLRYKFMKAFRGPPEYVHELMTKIAILRQFIMGLRERWEPFGDLPEGMAILAQLDELTHANQQSWEELCELCEACGALEAMGPEVPEENRRIISD